MEHPIGTRDPRITDRIVDLAASRTQALGRVLRRRPRRRRPWRAPGGPAAPVDDQATPQDFRAEKPNRSPSSAPSVTGSAPRRTALTNVA
jgi:hypothetical protein